MQEHYEQIQDIVSSGNSQAEGLIAALNRHTKALNRYSEAVEYDMAVWLSPEQAARVINIPITPNRNHRRRLAEAARKGFLPSVRPGKTPYYLKTEVVKLARRIATDGIKV